MRRERQLIDPGQVYDCYIRSNKNIQIMAPSSVNFITGNKNKLIELQAILNGVIEVQSEALDIDEIQGSIEDVTRDKCRRAAALVGTLNYSKRSHLLIETTDTRSSACGRHGPMLQCHGRIARSLYVCLTSTKDLCQS